MIKLLVSGLAVGKEAGFEFPRNYDFDWLLKYPSSIVWAERILVPKSVWESISEHRDRPLFKCIHLIINSLKSEGIVKIVNLSTDLTSDQFKKGMAAQIGDDLTKLRELYPNDIQISSDSGTFGKDRPSYKIENTQYCSTHIWSIYLSLAISKLLKAQCLFDDFSLTYCKYKFALNKQIKGTDKIEAYNDVFNTLMPNHALIPHYAIAKYNDDPSCNQCKEGARCEDSYLLEVEDALNKYLKYRDYEEIAQIRTVVGDLIKKSAAKSSNLDPFEVKREFDKYKRKLNRRLHFIFPKIQRWAKVGTLMSIPISLLTLDPSSFLGLTAISEGTKKTIEILKSQYSWVGFRINDAPSDTIKAD